MPQADLQEDVRVPHVSLLGGPPIEPVGDENGDEDIYRGQRPHSAELTRPESMAASSSGSFLTTARLGALAAVVEPAIARWARARANSSSSDSSHTSSIKTV